MLSLTTFKFEPGARALMQPVRACASHIYLDSGILS